MEEGYDDDNEEGAGEKLLHLLQKMGVENILIVVCVWHYGMPGQMGPDFFKMVLDRAKDLLSALHQKVMEAEKLEREADSRKIVLYKEKEPKKEILGTKVFPGVIIPEKQKSDKKGYRPNNFLSDQQKSPQVSESPTMPMDISESEFQEAIKLAELSVRKLTKAHLIELKSAVRPHPLIEKTLNMICMLKGIIAPNWQVAKDLMNVMTFKMELMLFDIASIKMSDINRVYKILNTTKNLNPDYVATISEGGALLLTWVINILKWYAGHKVYQASNSPSTLAGSKMDEFEAYDEYIKEQFNDTQNTLATKTKDDRKSSAKGEEGKKSPVKKNSKSKQEGYFLKSKQLVLSDRKVLVPSKERTPSVNVVELHNSIPPNIQREQTDEVEIPDIDNRNYAKSTLANFLTGGLKETPYLMKEIAGEIPEMPENEEDILRFIENAVLDEQPTEVLIRLAEKLKEKRIQQYPDQTISR